MTFNVFIYVISLNIIGLLGVTLLLMYLMYPDGQLPFLEFSSIEGRLEILKFSFSLDFPHSYFLLGHS